MVVDPVIHVKPLDFAISLQEAKQHLRLMHTSDEDEYVMTLIETAQEYVTKRSEITFTQTQYSATLSEFPCDGKLYLAYPPVTRASIMYWSGGSQTEFTGATLVSTNTTAYLDVSPTFWPVPDSRPDAITVYYTAGYANKNNIPSACRHAMKLLIGHWFVNRESVGNKNQAALAQAVDSLVSLLKSGRIGGGLY